MYNHISIIGGPGSGKSTLSNILSKEFELPVLHLDSIHHLQNWKIRDVDERDDIIRSHISDKQWIIDGNYKNTLKERLENSDLIIWLDYSTLTLLKGVIKHFIKNPNKEKAEIPGCKERLPFNFLKNVATYNRTKRIIIVNNLKDISSEKVLTFKKQKYLNMWLKDFINNDKIKNELI